MYALNRLGHLKEGERVLIHSAAGGVGLAAIQIATAVGAEIYATAGSEEKRSYLRELGLTHVMDSRNLDFVEVIRTQTDGTGVDVVLNSLAGEFIPASLEVLRPFGRFLEIGKRDIYNNTAIGLRPFRNNLSLHSIDLGPMITDRHPLLVEMLSELVEALGQGRFRPGPILSVPWEDTKRAIEHMAAARHIGKVVLVIRQPAARAPDGLSEQQASRLGYRSSIPLRHGLDLFQEILQRPELPPHLIVSVRPLGVDTDAADAPALQGDDGPRGQRASTVAYKAPSNPTEEEIVKIWQQVLSADEIGVDDDFMELGGDSITSIQILNRIRKTLGVRLSNDALFDFRTPARLGDEVQGRRAST